MTQACVGCQGHTIRGHDGTLSAVVSHATRPNGLVTPGECQLARPRRLGGMMFLLRALVSTLFLSPQHKKKEKIHMVNKEGSDPLHRLTGFGISRNPLLLPSDAMVTIRIACN